VDTPQPIDLSQDIVLVGPTGVGKTTVARLHLTLLRVDEIGAM
jgi:flagellar biosynthesis GTPase FlhF